MSQYQNLGKGGKVTLVEYNKDRNGRWVVPFDAPSWFMSISVWGVQLGMKNGRLLFHSGWTGKFYEISKWDEMLDAFPEAEFGIQLQDFISKYKTVQQLENYYLEHFKKVKRPY